MSFLLFQLERDVAAGLLAKPWSGWGPNCYDSSQWDASGKILGLYAWDFSQEDEAALTHLCKSLIWKLQWQLRLNSYLAPNVCLEIEEKLSQRLFFLVHEVSNFLLWLDFSSGDLSNSFDSNFSSVVWSHSWIAGVNMWGKRGIYSLFVFVLFPCGLHDSRRAPLQTLAKMSKVISGIFFLKSKILIIFYKYFISHFFSSLRCTFRCY